MFAIKRFLLAIGLPLALVYAALPCLLKLAAATLLWTYRDHLDRR